MLLLLPLLPYIQILSLGFRQVPIPTISPVPALGGVCEKIAIRRRNRNAHKILFNMSLKTETLLDYKRKLTTNRFRYWRPGLLCVAAAQ